MTEGHFINIPPTFTWTNFLRSLVQPLNIISKISKRELNFSKILVTRMRTIYEYYRH